MLRLALILYLLPFLPSPVDKKRVASPFTPGIISQINALQKEIGTLNSKYKKRKAT
jgi:hypothetical protein